ncbi:P-loop containing nucleoside triphosphate hydrolase protein [Fusarium flagelliforme]|uniref:P-loop containing nucleoside triphosphate hydrolase protein n=1 Tax=Fusarium flagelliforme TaxID=2675880 RepID=UPI001E8D30F1|nr:P-loop containing nucleoside triphosphate hydrolase protein [Fusarium flagelliforme]KAH7188883.1 P-loop containing nucleoside triphosphate hydrolase protein [Fusarium flagelliforme]
MAADHGPVTEKPSGSPSSSPPDESTQNAKEEESQAAAKTRPERTANFKDYMRIFSYATKWDFVAYAAGFFASIGAGITLPLMNVVFGQFVGNFTDYFLPGNTTSQSEFNSSIDKLALYMFFLFLGRFVLNAINKFVFRMIGIRLSSAIRLHYLQSLFGQSIHVLDSMPPGYATGTITSTANVLQLGISEKLGIFVEYNSTIVAALIVAFVKNWSLTLVTSSIILYLFLVLGIFLPMILKVNALLTKAEGRAGAVASEALASVRMVAACGAESRISKKYAAFVEETRQHGKLLSPLIGGQLGFVFFGLYAGFALCFWYGAKSYSEGRLDNVGDVLVVLLSVMIVVLSLERTSTPLLAVGKATVAACEFFVVIDAPQPPKGHLKDPEVSSTQDIVFEGVTFSYPSRPHVKVLDDLDLRIEAGKINAVVGPSGSGKSTIVGLIQRWYTLQDQHVLAKVIEKEKTGGKKNKKAESEEDDDLANPTETESEERGPPIEIRGRVTTSGQLLDDIELKWWRSQIGLVQQEPFLFNDTIYNNVAYGLIGTPWEDESEDKKRELVREACREAFADEFIDRLPDKYHSIVGDSGAKLSGGQRQRLAIARSIVRKPSILILDEATSAIDVRGERIVQAALDRVAKNRTTITIAHRLSTIKKADRIIVLKKGKVVESGTHDSLITVDGGVYSGLVHAQSLSLGEPTEAGYESVEPEDKPTLANVQSVAASEVEMNAEVAKGKKGSPFASFSRLFLESKNIYPAFALTLFAAACVGSGVPLQAWIFGKIIVSFNYIGTDSDRSESNFWALMFVVLAVGIGVSYFVVIFVATRMSATVRAKYQQQYFDAVMFQKTSFFDHEDHSHGTMTSRLGTDPKQLEEMMGLNMASVFVALFNVAGAVAIAFAHTWKLAVVSCCVVLPVMIISAYWRFKYELAFEKMNNDVFAESSKFASESIGAFRTVTSLTLEDSICLRYQNLLDEHVVSAYKKARWVSILFGFSDSASMACQALNFWWGGRLLSRYEIGLVAFFVCFMAITNGSEAAGQALGFGPNAALSSAAADRILKMRESRPQDKVSTSQEIPDIDGGMSIELDNIHFKYPTRSTPVFKGLSLKIEKGQFAALVGASGCGKTSIISLMERFYDLDKGRILLNGKDSTDINLYEYRKYFSLVAQEATLFQGTLRENILLGVDPASITDEQLHQACRDASIHDFIVSLPDGLNTNVGSRGVSLSGGQKQRVAIARALIRDPKVLLLDEATSSLDSESEKLVQAAFERASEGRTMLAVAHRLATVQNADVIFVLGDGQLLEQGSHVELLRKRGVYWHMCQSQALDR